MEAAETGVIAVLAEKPSVARDIARVLGADKRGEGYLQGNGYVVTWAIGHLVALAQPHEINPQWRSWQSSTLPMLPNNWPLVVQEKTKDQFEIVRKIINSSRVSSVICATDAGREGELIFRYIYEAADCEKPFRRLWISSLTPDAIRRGFETLRSGADLDTLADAACGRSRADWLVGMNLSRAYSLAFDEELSVGRVQTPTLAMLVERELILQSFVPEDYLEVIATFHAETSPPKANYRGTWFRAKQNAAPDGESLQSTMRLPPDALEAKAIVARARSGAIKIESVQAETQRTLPPLLYDLTELQRHANRLFGLSAQNTLDIAQALYERHKLISYPRTDSRHLSQDLAGTLPRIVAAISAPYRKELAPGTGERPLSRRFIDDSKVSDHHAIIPTAASSDKSSLSPDERKIYDLVCRRLLSAWHDDYIIAVTTVITAISNAELVDRYHSSGTTVEQLGWKILDLAPERKRNQSSAAGSAEQEAQSLPTGLRKDEPVQLLDIEPVRKKTRPPKRFTEATLLTAMETAGKSLEERELSQAMKESGLGTPATRASIIEVLLKRNYIARNGKSLEATPKGIRLIEVVHSEVKSPAMTGQWEAYLGRIQHGQAQLEPFLDGIKEYVRKVVGKVEDRPHEAKPAEVAHSASVPPKQPKPAPLAIQTEGQTPQSLLHAAFGFSEFRPNQEAVCRAAIEGKDVLLVMPTGAGKSLCYQLPGLARGGVTLVISPLIALMEDQVAKLKERGFQVERIHSGRDRKTSREVCLDYLAGKLQFLFIAPERLRVTGFPEMLAKRKPSLIAIDEAHCISQWGHDFRPDYRMLGRYLPALRPAPVIALTATATQLVQRDIAQQLGLTQADKFIHGFRRDNIAIEVVEVAPSQRAGLARDILLDAESRPAIVYVPTRKQAELVSAELARNCATATYHAGLDAEHRSRVQQNFLDGKIQVMVATIAFGMGIDKPDVRTVIHTGLPGSLEGYYQEIGRAGRDGAPSRAVLMYSYADRHTHDFFFDRDYPDVKILDRIFGQLTGQPVQQSELRRHLRLEEDLFEKALEKLWMHGGALIDADENIRRGEAGWEALYLAVGKQKSTQIDGVLRYAASHQCRMSSLVSHFGDTADARSACGLCDFCSPQTCTAQRFRALTEAEQSVSLRIVGALRPGLPKSTGKLHAELCSAAEITRDAFEQLLGSMARAGLLTQKEEAFEKDGKQIAYRTVSLTDAGHQITETTTLDILMKDDRPSIRKARKRKKQTPAAARTKTRRSQTGKPTRSEAPNSDRIEASLRAWRLSEARRRAVPAFRIFTDRVLKTIAAQRPTSDSELLAISGIGMATVKQYGPAIYRVVHSLSNT